MKKYRVVVSERAWDDIESACEWIAEAAPISAARWYNRLIESLNTLRSFPDRHPLAPEDPLFDETIRQLLYGKRRPRYEFFTQFGTSRFISYTYVIQPATGGRRTTYRSDENFACFMRIEGAYQAHPSAFS